MLSYNQSIQINHGIDYFWKNRTHAHRLWCSLGTLGLLGPRLSLSSRFGSLASRCQSSLQFPFRRLSLGIHFDARSPHESRPGHATISHGVDHALLLWHPLGGLLLLLGSSRRPFRKHRLVADLVAVVDSRLENAYPACHQSWYTCEILDHPLDAYPAYHHHHQKTC